MTEAPAQGQGQQTPEAADTQVQQAEERTFTQADLKKIAANEKREGKSAAINDVLERTGAESIDEIFSVYEAHKATQAEMETAADRAEKAREKAENRAKEAESRYTSTLKEYALRDALRDAGINAERLPLALRVADMNALEVDKEGGVGGVEDVVQAVQEASPEWFAQEDAPAPRRAPDLTPRQRTSAQTPEDMQAAWLSQFIGTRQ